MSRPPIKCDHLYIISASIFDYSFTTNAKRGNFASLCQNAGITAPNLVTTWSNRGDVIADYVAKLPDALADAKGKENVYFLFHGPGNDITNSGPWPGASDTIGSQLHRMFRDIWYAGHKIMYATTTYRVPPASNPSAPYNQFLLKDLIRKYSPDFWQGGPLFDLYEVTFNNQGFILADGVHPNDNGMMQLRAFTAKTLAHAVRGYPEPTPANGYRGKRVVFDLGDKALGYEGINGCVGNVEPTGTTGEGAAQYSLGISATDGSRIEGPHLRAHWFTNVNMQGRGNAGDTSASLSNNTLLSSSVYVTPGADRAFIEINNLPTGLTGTLRVTASRSADAADRVAEITYRGETLTLDGAASPAEVIEWPLVVEDGKIRLDVRCQSGSTYAYVSGIQFDFD